MEEVKWTSLLAVSVATMVVPVLFAKLPGVRIPAVVGELVAGIILGKSALGWIAESGPYLDFLFSFGLAFVLFLAGMETNPESVSSGFGRGWRGMLQSSVGLAAIGSCISLVLAFAVTIPLSMLDLLPGPMLVAILIASTSIGVLLAVLGERGELRQPYGQRLLVMAAVADILTILLLTIFFSVDESGTAQARVALIVALLVLGIVLFLTLSRLAARPALLAFVSRLGGTTSQISIRASFTLMLVFVALASGFGLEIILGSFIAGAIISALGVPQHGEYQVKMEAIGHGFFVPVFFVLAGARLDIPALFAASDRLLLIPILLVSIYIIKTVPMWLYRHEFTLRENLAAGALQSAQLTLTVAGTEIGLRTGVMDQALASALISVALINTVIAPIVFSRLMAGNERVAVPVLGISAEAEGR